MSAGRNSFPPPRVGGAGGAEPEPDDTPVIVIKDKTRQVLHNHQEANINV